VSVQHVTDGSVWQLLQTRDLPKDSWCRTAANDRQQEVWHAWNAQSRYCDFHKVNGMKAPVARAVAHRRSQESLRRPRSIGAAHITDQENASDPPAPPTATTDQSAGAVPSRPRSDIQE
jgi:hypothetical protein